jgi:DNA-binding MarR family transcriptional regulator
MDRDILTLARLARMLERVCSTACDPPLTLAQYRLLAMIGDGADKASDLAGQLALGRPTVSATVDTLVERGLVARTTSGDDRRVVQLTLTEAGAGEVRRAEEAMRARLDDVLARVDDPVAVRQVLSALAHGLDERREERREERRAAKART